MSTLMKQVSSTGSSSSANPSLGKGDAKTVAPKATSAAGSAAGSKPESKQNNAGGATASGSPKGGVTDKKEAQPPSKTSKSVREKTDDGTSGGINDATGSQQAITPAPSGLSRIRLVEITQGESAANKVLCRPSALDLNITLAAVRPKLVAWISRTHQFCYSDGSREDESTMLKDYFALARSLEPTNASQTSANAAREESLYVLKPTAGSTLPTNIPVLEKPDLGQRLTLGTAVADRFVSQDHEFQVHEKVKGGMLKDAKHASELSADEWNSVLLNCSAFFGWYVNRETSKVEQAPKPAFQLRRDRSKLQPNTAAGRSTALQSSSVPRSSPASVPATANKWVSEAASSTVADDGVDASSSTENKDNAAAAQPALGEVDPGIPPSIDSKSGTGMATATLKENDKVQNDAKSTLSSTTDKATELQKEIQRFERAWATRAPPPPDAPLPSSRTQASFDMPEALTNDALPLIRPRFHVSDNSRVEVFTISNEFQASMAKNDFSAQSTEASVSGGYGGFGASVSGGYASSESKSSKSSTSSFEKTMVAKYMYPRATVSLEPSDLEPTPELWEALVNLRKTKSVTDMRRLHREFGHLFCRQVTIGGRLLSTKIMKETKTTEEQSAKEEFKASVAVAVTTPWVSASVKHEESGGKSSDESKGSKQSDERHAFEAVGGDTILSNDPPAWAQTCSLHANWRVIDRVALTPIADAISDLPRLVGVKTLFAQAVPTLSRVIEMPHGSEIPIRLSLKPFTNGWFELSRPSVHDSYWYLGHELESYAMPISMLIRDSSDFWGGVKDDHQKRHLFNPKWYRAPALYGYAGKDVSVEVSSTAAKDPVSTVWNLSAPFDRVLTHGCLVVLRMAPSDKDGKVMPKPLSLAVFRNQQGVFLPAMSDDEQPQMFRVLKEGAVPGQTILEDDVIRLSWDVKDQTVGYRDFQGDAFGRRQTSADVDMPLYFKLPYPTFEKVKIAEGDSWTRNDLVMSSESSTANTKTMLRTLADAWSYTKARAFVLRDVSFRINVTDPGGRGEADNYMTGAPKVKVPEPQWDIKFVSGFFGGPIIIEKTPRYS